MKWALEPGVPVHCQTFLTAQPGVTESQSNWVKTCSMNACLTQQATLRPKEGIDMQRRHCFS